MWELGVGAWAGAVLAIMTVELDEILRPNAGWGWDPWLSCTLLVPAYGTGMQELPCAAVLGPTYREVATETAVQMGWGLSGCSKAVMEGFKTHKKNQGVPEMSPEVLILEGLGKEVF